MKNHVKNQINKKFIDLEKKRSYFAKNHDLKSLLNLYKSNISIKDNNSGAKWDKMNFISEINWTNNPMAYDRTLTISKLLNYTNKNVLNIGFGPLNIEKLLLNERFKGKWTGIDISIKSVNKAKYLFPKHKFIYGSILNNKFKANTFDIVLALEVLEHIPADRILSILKYINKILTTNGFIILSIPINEGLENLLSIGSNPNAHLRIYTEELIKAELEISNFKVLRTISLSAFHQFYSFKKLISSLIPNLFTRNNLIILAQKL